MKNVKRLFVTLILVVLANLMVQAPAYAKPHFNEHDVLFLKKGKSKTVKIKGLSKKQKKKKWKFECSHDHVATIKQKGKYSFTIKAKKSDGFACVRAKQGKSRVYLWVVVDNGIKMSPEYLIGGETYVFLWEAFHETNQLTKYEKLYCWTTTYHNGHSFEAVFDRAKNFPRKITVPPEYGAKNNVVYAVAPGITVKEDINGIPYGPASGNCDISIGDMAYLVGVDEDYKPIYPIGVKNYPPIE
jgi:hypothetical protein